jgi:transposase
MVEQLFRSAKSLLETRPVFHKYDRTIRGHVFCSFLALVLRRALQDRLDAKGYSFEWADIMLSLDGLTETEINHQSKRFILRSDPDGTCARVFQAVGVALPPAIRQIPTEKPK